MTSTRRGPMQLESDMGQDLEAWAERNQIKTRAKSSIKMAAYAGAAYLFMHWSYLALKENAIDGRKADETSVQCSVVKSDLEETLLSAAPISQDKMTNLSAKIESLQKPFYETGQRSQQAINHLLNENNIVKSFYTPGNEKDEKAYRKHLLTTIENLGNSQKAIAGDKNSNGYSLVRDICFGLSLCLMGLGLANAYRVIKPKI